MKNIEEQLEQFERDMIAFVNHNADTCEWRDLDEAKLAAISAGRRRRKGKKASR